MEFELSKKEKSETYLKTGFFELDTLLKLKKNEGAVITIGARLSMGKTTFISSIAKNLFERNERVLYFSLERSKELLYKYHLSPKVKLHVDDTARISPEAIEEKIKEIKPNIVFIDYLQLIAGNESQNRFIQLEEIMKKLKQIAVENNVLIFIASWISYDIDKRRNKRPVLSDFHDSGTIQNLSDVVMFLYRDEYYNKKAISNKTKMEIEVIIAKNKTSIEINSVKITINALRSLL